MLQINTGKLFDRGVARTNLLRGVLHTNLCLYHEQKIETPAGILLSTGGFGKGTKALVYEVEERIEATPDGRDFLISRTVAPFLRDFSVVASFGLNTIMSPDPALASRMTSSLPTLASYDPPGRYVRRYFDEEVWLQEGEAEGLSNFVTQLLALERRSYLGAMRAMRTYIGALHRLQDDLALAYTLLVTSLESLAQDFDGHRNAWTDLDDRKRAPLDKALKGAPKDVADRVRGAILDIEHASLGRRFRDHTLTHVEPSFFRERLSPSDRPIGRAELQDGLRQAYDIRSKYVHNIRDLPDALTLGHGFPETVRVDHVTTLTFQGLARLARHVIQNFVARQPTILHESCDYTLEQPGVVSIELSPEYWVGVAAKLSPKAGRQRLEGFLQQLVGHLQKVPDAKLTDLREMLDEAERMLPSMTAGQRLPFLALYALFNLTVSAKDRMPDFEAFWSAHAAIFEKPSSESLILHTLVGQSPSYTLSAHVTAHEAYFRRRSRPNGLQLPRLLEAAVTLFLAERCRVEGEPEEARRLLTWGVENYPGHGGLVGLERDFDESRPIQWRTVLLPPPSGAGIQ